MGRARYPAFFRDAARLETQAVELHVYANQAVPGLLRTEEYGILRAEALTPRESPAFIEKLLGER
ncbi:hypothetical protein GCM10010389_02480 [Streptomyces echinoruber]|uniref:DUF5753 domain-containing protein n=1 Tax=Streptomyces echinoruber TaxID=68898 RepID=A0A918QV80_9ACTN|nr:hypothetical protein GCM10010389_02480 [Streptomyces echinoruber]